MTRDPLALDVANVLSRPGVRHPYQIEAPLPGVKLTSTEIPDGQTVVVDLVLEAQGTDVIVEGTAHTTWQGECRRCLEPTSGQVQLDLQEIYSEHPVEGETFPFDGERLNLAPMLREAFTLALPLVPLCREDCPGPDPDQHPVQTAGETDTPKREDDPWDALDQLRFE
jgi:uncharacterized protein